MFPIKTVRLDQPNNYVNFLNLKQIKNIIVRRKARVMYNEIIGVGTTNEILNRDREITQDIPWIIYLEDVDGIVYGITSSPEGFTEEYVRWLIREFYFQKGNDVFFG